MATQDDRSLGSSSFFPKWMKSKMNNKFDLNQSAFSPTELDDSFMFYYRQPNNVQTNQITVMDGKVVTASKQITSGQADFANIASVVDQSLLSNKVTVPTVPSDVIKPKVKPKGTDDGFKGETAKVGSTVVRVANQMVAGKIIKGAPAKPEEECEQLLAKFDPYRRRGSKSLPASPLATPDSSPKSKRRVNKFFTGPFVDTENKSGWILSNLLARREFSKSIGYNINEETKEEVDRASSTASIDSIKGGKQNVYKAKPSELREMNFWSPTSM